MLVSSLEEQKGAVPKLVEVKVVIFSNAAVKTIDFPSAGRFTFVNVQAVSQANSLAAFAAISVVPCFKTRFPILGAYLNLTVALAAKVSSVK